MTEPDVALTDYALSLESFIFYLVLKHSPQRNERLQKLFVPLFAALALASLAGGTVHGFLHGNFILAKILWRFTLLNLGYIAWCLWCIGFEVEHLRPGRWLRLIASFEFFIYALTIIFFSQAFWVAILNYLPAALFVFCVYLKRYSQSRDLSAWWASLGLILTFIAAVLQQAHVGLNAHYFNHNALYHLIQGLGLGFIFWSQRNKQ